MGNHFSLLCGTIFKVHNNFGVHGQFADVCSKHYFGNHWLLYL